MGALLGSEFYTERAELAERDRDGAERSPAPYPYRTPTNGYRTGAEGGGLLVTGCWMQSRAKNDRSRQVPTGVRDRPR